MNVEHNSLYQSHHDDWKQAPLSRKEDDTESYKSTEDNITEKNSLEQSQFCSKEVSKLVEPMTTLSSVEGSGSYMSMLLDDLSDIDEDEDEDINYRRKKICAKEDQDVKNLFESETSNHLSNLVEQNEKERQVRSFMSPKFNDNRSSTTDISNLSGLANFEPISVPVTSLKDTLINYSLIMPSCLQQGANQTNASCGSPQREKENENSEKLREVQTIEELKRKIKNGNKVMSKSNTVHLSNLPNKFTRVEALNAIFKRFGTIVNIHVDDYTKRAYVEYKTEQEAIKAVKMANQLKLNFFGNNKIIISEVANTFINETITTIDTVLAELTNIIRTILSLRKHQADKHKLDSKITMVKELMKKLKKDNSIEKHRAELKRFGIILC